MKPAHTTKGFSRLGKGLALGAGARSIPIDDIIRNLATLSSPALTQLAVERIESKVLHSLLITPPSPVNNEITDEDLSEHISDDEISAFLAESSPLPIVPMTSMEAIGVSGSLVPARALPIGAGVAILVCSALIFATSAARPGALLHPLRTKIEAVRLFIAASPVAKANVYMRIAQNRLDSLSSISSDQPELMTQTLAQMSLATLHGLRLIEGADDGTARIDAVRRLDRLARAQSRTLIHLMRTWDPRIADALSSSYQVASSVATWTRESLSGRSLSFMSGTFRPPAGPPSVTGGGRVSRSNRTDRRTPDGDHVSTKVSPPDGQGDTTGPEPESCDGASAMLCVSVPDAVTLPPLPSL